MKHVKGKITKDTKLLGRKEKVLDHIDGNILDIGCGEGELLIKATLLDHDIIGMDRDANEIRTAMETGKESDALIRIVQGDADNIPFEEESFDTIVMGEVIEHLSNLLETVKNVLKHLKPGGKLIITTPSGFAHMDNDHKNFFFKKKNFELMNKHWVFNLLPAIWLNMHGIIIIEEFLEFLGYEYDLDEIEYGDSKHPSLDLFIVIWKIERQVK